MLAPLPLVWLIFGWGLGNAGADEVRLRSRVGSRVSFSLIDPTGDDLCFSFSGTSLELLICVVGFGVTGRCDDDLRPPLECKRAIEKTEFRSEEWVSSEPLDNQQIKGSGFYATPKIETRTHDVEYLGGGFLDLPSVPENEAPNILRRSPAFPVPTSMLFLERCRPMLGVSLSLSFSFSLAGDPRVGDAPSLDAGVDSPFELEEPCLPKSRRRMLVGAASLCKNRPISTRTKKDMSTHLTHNSLLLVAFLYDIRYRLGRIL